MKKLISILLTTIVLFGWEINTHRVIDKKAIGKATNLNKFIDASGIAGEDYVNERFETYGVTYFNTRKI